MKIKNAVVSSRIPLSKEVHREVKTFAAIQDYTLQEYLQKAVYQQLFLDKQLLFKKDDAVPNA